MSKNSIKLKNYSNVFEEIVAVAGITPGMLLELTSAGKVQAHSTAGGNAAPLMFALEDELQGKGIDDAYIATDPVSVWIPGRGDQVQAILVDGQNVAIGDLLESNGAGLLQKYVADTTSSGGGVVVPNPVVGEVIAAVDLSDSSGAESSGPLAYDKRVEIRIV